MSTVEVANAATYTVGCGCKCCAESTVCAAGPDGIGHCSVDVSEILPFESTLAFSVVDVVVFLLLSDSFGESLRCRRMPMSLATLQTWP